MHFGIAINFACRGQQKARSRLFCEPQQVARAKHVGQHRVLRIGLIVRRRCGTGQVVNVREFQAAAPQPLRQRVNHIMFDEFEATLALEMREIVGTAGLQIVQANHLRAVADQPIAQMRTNEAGTAGYERNLPVLTPH